MAASTTRRTALAGGAMLLARLAAVLPVVAAVPAALAGGNGVTTLASVSTAGKQGNGPSSQASISGDGRLVVFDSQATNFVRPDTTGPFDDIFLRDRKAATTTLVDVSSKGVQGFGQTANPVISRDGRLVAFESAAANLVPGDTNDKDDVFVRELAAGTTTRASVGTGGSQLNGSSALVSVSADGRFVLFFSFATNLPGGGSQVYVRDRKAGTTVLQPTNAAGRPLDQPVLDAAITPNGRYLVFDSEGTDVLPGGAGGAFGGVFRLDRTTGVTRLASAGKGGKPANSFSFGASVSDDGDLVTFQSDATNLAPGGTGGHVQVYLRDLQAGKTERVSAAPTGASGDGDSTDPLITPDGRYILFDSYAGNLAPGLRGSGGEHLLRYDRVTRAMAVVNVTPAGAPSVGDVLDYAMSADGSTIAFASDASDLVVGDRNKRTDVFVRVLGGGRPQVAAAR